MSPHWKVVQLLRTSQRQLVAEVVVVAVVAVDAVVVVVAGVVAVSFLLATRLQKAR